MADNYFGVTDAGRERDNNEDSFIAQAVFSKQSILACVIDGVGGYEGGEVAAQLTRDAIIQHLNKLPADIIGAMVAALGKANERIFKEKIASRQNEKMACVVTLAIVDLEKNKFSYAHVGDTRLYLFRDSSLVKITNDHSTVGFLEESGRLTETAAMQHPKRNEVNKALGYEASISLAADFIDTGESPFLPGDTILLCSDGLTDMISSSEITSILNNRGELKARAQQLVLAANEAGGKDNITVVLVHNNKLPAKHAITKPLAAVKSIAHENVVDLAETPDKSTINLEAPLIEKTKSGKGTFFIILFLFLVGVAGFAWFYFQRLQQDKEPKLLMPPAKQQTNNDERKLTDSINATSLNKTISLMPGHRVVITDSVLIGKDSLHIKGNGATLIADSGYKGPALVLASTCKYILLDSLILSGFNIGILVHKKGLHLKNVQFVNCVVPLLLEHQFPLNKFISGAPADTIFYHQDSLHKYFL